MDTDPFWMVALQTFVLFLILVALLVMVYHYPWTSIPLIMIAIWIIVYCCK